jgi:hypothetical protein
MVGGQIPARRLAGGEGKRGKEQEGREGYLVMASVGAGMAEVGLPAVACLAAGASSAPVRESEGGRAREFQWVEGNLS